MGIYLDTWETPAEEELIGGSRPHRTFLVFEIWCYEFGLENKSTAQKRDTLLEEVKDGLKGNRNLNGKVLVTRFKGGDFDNAQKEEGFFKGVSIKLECEVKE